MIVKKNRIFNGHPELCVVIKAILCASAIIRHCRNDSFSALINAACIIIIMLT